MKRSTMLSRRLVLPLLLAPLFLCPGEVHGQPHREQMLQGLELLRAGNLEQARSLFEEIVRDDPRHGPARLQLGTLALEQGALEEAREHLEIAAGSNVRRPFLAWHLLGRVFLLEEDLDRARECFERSLESAPDFAPARLLLAEISERQGDDWAALAGYRQVLERAPDSLEAQTRLAKLARAMGAYDLAECHARAASMARPDDGYLHYLLAVIRSDSGHVEEALKSCSKAIELGFEDAHVYLTLGNLYYQKMQLSESIAALGKAVERDPEAAEAIASFALTSLTTEDLVGLKALLERHLEAHPDNVNTLYSLGAMFLRENELERAREYFLRLESLAPRHAAVHYNLGLIYLREGRAQESEAAMARFQELKAEEGREWVKNNQAHATRQEAKAAVSAGNPEAAIELYVKMAAEGTAEKPDLIAAGRAMSSVGRYREALAWFEKVLQSLPYDREVLAGLAEAAEGSNESEIAERCRERLDLLSSPCPTTSARQPSEGASPGPRRTS